MSGATYNLPAYRIAIVQDESETLHNPTLDVMGALGDRERWRCQIFNERTFEALLLAQTEFDCIVLGSNVVYRNPELGCALSRVTVGLVMLHQLRLPQETKLGPALRASTAKLDRESSDHHAHFVPQRDRKLEILLNWPEVIDPEALKARIASALQTPPDMAWRRVIDLDPDGGAVLMRSMLTSSPRVVACTLLLESGDPTHRDLIRNLVVYCAAGAPSVVAVAGKRAPWAETLSRKLRVRGIHAVAHEGTADSLDFECWPLRTASDVIVPRGQKPLPNQEAWITRGGRLTAVDPKTHELHVLYRAPDAHWVARRWSEWLHTGAADERLCESVMTARSYLRTLHALRNALHGDLRRFGLRDIDEHRDEIASLVRTRLAGADHLEETIGATAAVLELGKLVPGAIDELTMGRVAAWLRAAADQAGAEDRLEIARILADGQLLRESLVDLRRPFLASTVVRLRRATLACDVQDLDVRFEESDRELIVAEAGSSLLNGSEYLSSLAAVQASDPSGDYLLSGDALLADAAVDGLIRHGVLSGENPSAACSPEEVCSEALALITYLGLDDVPTSELVRAETAPTAPFVEDALREGLKLRETNASLRSRKRHLERVLAQRDERLHVARALLGITVVALAIGVAVAGAWISSDHGPSGSFAFLTDFLAPIALGALTTAGLGTLLAHHDLCPPWLVTLVTTVAGGVDGIKTFALGALGRATDQSSIREASEAYTDEQIDTGDHVRGEGDPADVQNDDA